MLVVASLFLCQAIFADGKGRPPSPQDGDPCGIPDTTTAAYRLAASLNWGYGFDSLQADIARWRMSPFVHIDSIGATVQNRPIYMLTIEDTAATTTPRKRVMIHARTHPNEVQGTWVTNQMISQLLGTSSFANALRKGAVFNIVPMINPDGVELAYLRQNAHNIDIESNWTAVPGEPEVQTLRRTFTTLMATPNPIRIALNMHSAYGEVRYFVFHTAAGTTPAYAGIEQRFINNVRKNFPGGIQPYTYFVSWTSAPSLVYPESWFWQNHGENVLALTYEDMNSDNARAFDSTANAILRGVAEELGVVIPTAVATNGNVPDGMRLSQNFPNPFNPATTIQLSLEERQLTIVNVYDVLGREVAVLLNEVKDPGTYTLKWDAHGMASGMYICRMIAGNRTLTRTMTLVR
jgi:hypothetical protein